MNRIKQLVITSVVAFLVVIGIGGTAHAYTIDQTYALGSNGGKHVRTANNYIVAHDVGTDSSAINNAQFEHRTWSSNQAYVTYIVGDGGHVYQIGTPGNVAWGAGSYANANSPVQVELAHTSCATQFKVDYATYVALLRNSAKAYGLPVRLDQGRGIITHLYVTQHWWGNHQDPYGYLARWGITKAQFAHDIAYGVSASGVITSNQGSTGTDSNASSNTTDSAATATRHAENGTFKAGQKLTVWTGPGYGSTGVSYYAGESFSYDSYVINGNYVYASYLTNSGARRYVAIREYSSQRALGTFGSDSTTTAKSSNSAAIAVDGIPGYHTYLGLQRLYGMKYQDGKISKPSPFVKVLQKHVGVKQDGYFGPVTYRDMQRKLGTPVDGRVSRPSLMWKQIQRDINNGVKPF